MTINEALLASNLDWTVSKVPVLSAHDLTPVKDKYAVIRDDTKHPLGVVGKRYEPISNRESFRVFETALGEGQGQIDTIGALGEGERVWCLAKLPETFEPIQGDPVDRYLLCCTSHDGSKSMEIMFTSIRVVCNNTLTAALNGSKHKVSIRHTSRWEDRLRVAHQVLNQSSLYWYKMKQACHVLANESVGRVETGAFLDAMFPQTEAGGQRQHTGRSEVLRLLEEGKGSEIAGVRGSKWGLYNAFTEYIDHSQSIKGNKDRWERSTFGAGADQREKALSLLL
jgi:phage/plasmid-like protein (TIGR03299 family)